MHSNRNLPLTPAVSHWCCSWILLAVLPLVMTPPDEQTPNQPSWPVEVARPVITGRALTAREESRRSAINRCLAIYYMRPVDADELRPWSIMHGLIAYGRATQVVSRGRVVSAVEYLCHNGPGDDRRLMQAPGDSLHLNVGEGVQGHDGQFLAMLAQSGVSPDQILMVDGKKFQVRDLIEYEQRGCRPGTELTFRLLGLSYYLDGDATWQDDRDETWNFARLMGEEINQPVVGAACGGTHRLMGISYAIAMRRQQGLEFNASWQAAAAFIADYQRLALQMQNRDGSFSTDWFEGPAADKSAKRRLYTTGHILEWLVFSLPGERLTDPQITRAVDYLTHMMLAAPGYELDVGPRGHALHALSMYHDRVFGKTSYREIVPEVARLTGGLKPAREATPQDEPPTGPFRGIFGRRR